MLDKILKKQLIDIQFDFTSDTPGYWDHFWEKNNGLGAGNNDPDIKSKTLQAYHQFLWSKLLPNGEKMDLSIGSGLNYLIWKNFRFGSDSITTSFRYVRYQNMIKKIQNSIFHFQTFMENYIRKSYTIGGTIIFPKRHGGINQSRGCNPSIKDRWDLTLECIRKYYLDEPSPLYTTLKEEKAFFDLFIDFQGYVDFFYLQDCVSPDYSSVIFWLGDGNFSLNPLPQSVEEYLDWIDCNLKFVKQRNARILKAIQ